MRSSKLTSNFFDNIKQFSLVFSELICSCIIILFSHEMSLHIHKRISDT